jgi:hypothetical protein
MVLAGAGSFWTRTKTPITSTKMPKPSRRSAVSPDAAGQAGAEHGAEEGEGRDDEESAGVAHLTQRQFGGPAYIRI